MARDRDLPESIRLERSNFMLDLNNLNVSSDDDDDYMPSPPRNGFSRRFPPGNVPRGRPLIGYATNKWESRSSSASSSASCELDAVPYLGPIMSVVFTQRFMHYMMIYAFVSMFAYVGWEAFLHPMIQEPEILIESLNKDTMEKKGGWFGMNIRPEFADLIPMKTLDPAYLPSFEMKSPEDPSRRRLVVIGDVHGCKDELEKLLQSVNFDRTAGDHLIFTGDLINKGPDSAGVVDMARDLGASCVRGNHEDRILLERIEMQNANPVLAEFANQSGILRSDTDERKLAMSLSDEQVAWLQDCPVMLKVGPVREMGEVVVVHAGLIPGLPLDRQELTSVMSMRTLALDTHVPDPGDDGIPWYKLFNQYNKLISSGERWESEAPALDLMTAIYGHDAAHSLNIRPFTKGLDSGCVYGRKLSALVIEDGGKSDVVQVKCKKYA